MDVGFISAARTLVGQEIARYRRQKTFPVNPNYLPSRLRSQPAASDFAPRSTLAGSLPVTLYWGMERNVDLDGVRPPGIPRWMGRFDWVIGFEYGWANTANFPRSVLCEPTYLPQLLAYIKRKWPDPDTNFSLLAVTVGPDFLLSWQRKSLMRELKKYFSCVFYEAKDLESSSVSVLPMGIIEHYSRANAGRVMDLAQGLSRHPCAGDQVPSVLAAWGAWWPGLDELVSDRRLAREFASRSPLVTEGILSSDEWFAALAEYDFMLCPMGNGVQTSRLMEGLLMGCIPIATKHPTFVELQERGVPLLLIEAWDDIDESLLMDSYVFLFPEVQRFRTCLFDLESWWSLSFPCHQHEPALFAERSN